MSAAENKRSKIVFFAPDPGDVSTLKRYDAFRSNGFDVIVFSFRREGWYHAEISSSFPFISLGVTADERYANRILALLRGFLVLVRNRSLLDGASIFYARNLDQLALATVTSLLFARAPIGYEVLDVPRALTGGSLKSRLMRFAERLMLRRVQLLITSSAGYIEKFYHPRQAYAGEWILVENKLGPEALPLTRAVRRQSRVPDRKDGQYRWTVGYFGTIKGEETFRLITEIAARVPDVRFLFRGIVTSVSRETFERALRDYTNIDFEGPYNNPTDLPAMYSAVDMTWAIDLTNVGTNSDWCMACRYYESGAFGSPLLAAASQKVGQEVKRLGTGWSFHEPYKDTIVDFLKHLDRAQYHERQKQLSELPIEHFVDLDGAQSLAAALRQIEQ